MPLLVVAAAAAAALMLGGCGNKSGETAAPGVNSPVMGSVEDSWSGAGPELVMLGDSITYLSRTELHRRLNESYRTKITGLIGEGFAGGPQSSLAGGESSLIEQTAQRYASDKPSVAVIALGTNDAWNPSLEPTATLRGITSIVRSFAHSCLVAVGITEDSDADNYDRNEARSINAKLREVADVFVPALPPELLRSGGIHPTDAGRGALAEEILRGAQSCIGVG